MKPAYLRINNSGKSSMALGSPSPQQRHAQL